MAPVHRDFGIPGGPCAGRRCRVPDSEYLHRALGAGDASQGSRKTGAISAPPGAGMPQCADQGVLRRCPGAVAHDKIAPGYKITKIVPIQGPTLLDSLLPAEGFHSPVQATYQAEIQS